MNILTSLIIFLFVFISGSAQAFSCAEMTDRVIGYCKERVCADVYYISETKASGSCGRRILIKDPPEWARPVIELEVGHLPVSADGVYQLALSKSYFGEVFLFKNFDEYVKYREDTVEPLAELIFLKDANVVDVVDSWKDKEIKEYIFDLLWKVANWLCLLLSLIFIYLSVAWFDEWINKKRTWRVPLLALMMQIALFSFVLYMLLGWTFYLIFITALMMPGLWFYQLSLLISRYIAKKLKK